MRLGQAQLPRDAGVLDRGQRGGAGPAIVAGDQDHVGMRLGDARRHRSHPHLGHELHADPRVVVGVLEVVDELRKVLDRVDVVVRRRRDEPDARRGVAGLGDPRVDLGARQLAALAGLGALGHLDLDLAGVDEVLAGDAEAAAGDLLDGAAARVAVGQRLVARRVLAALAGVGLAAQAVHGDGEGLVGLARDGAVAHGAGLEPAHDRLDGLHLVDGHRAQRRPQLQQPAEGGEAGGLVVHERRVVLERRVVAGPDGLLERVDRERVEQVVLAVGPVLVLAAGRQLAVDDRAFGRIRAVLAQLDLAGDDLDADAADPARRPGEVLVHEVPVEAQRLEHLGAVVAVDRGDAHPGDRLDHALDHGLAVALLRLGRGSRDDPQAHLVVDRLEREVGVDGGGAVPDEQAEVVRLARLARLEHQAHAPAGAGADEVVVDGGDGEQRRDRARRSRRGPGPRG